MKTSMTIWTRTLTSTMWTTARMPISRGWSERWPA
jgi:hypothetical protein